MDKDILSYVTAALASFDRDPADSYYQLGYQAALVELKAWLDAKPVVEGANG